MAETVDVTIPEGYNVSQIIALLAEKGISTEEKLTDAAANHVFEGYGFVDNENLGSVTRLEGYLYPDTYNFYVGRDPALAFNAMLNNFKKQIYTDSEISGLLSDWEESGYSSAISSPSPPSLRRRPTARTGTRSPPSSITA